MRTPLILTAALFGAFVGTSSAQFSEHPTAASAQKGRPSKATKTIDKSMYAPLPGTQSLQPIVLGSSTLVGGSDSCTTPDVISGTGLFAFDNTVATTGTQGQLEAICNFYGQTDILNDVWFTWTAPSNGLAVLTSCSVTTIDTKIAIYNGVGCPSSSSIACNDDYCPGFQSQVTWLVTAGQTYTIQLGLYPGSAPPAVPGAGTFSLVVSVPPVNDTCAAPTTVVGSGPHNFDNTLAATGTEGQAESLCNFFGSTTIDSDVWYTWTSTFTGVAEVTTCGTTGVDTKIAAYAGAGCPTSGSAIGCNEDNCSSLQSRTLFPVNSGSTYTIQIGTFPGATGGTGTFSINQVIVPANDNCATPVAIAGVGPHAFDTTNATTGTQGQTEGLCFFFGSTTVELDTWYTWTASSSGLHVLSFCAGSFGDTKVAVYAGAGCPAPGTALACNDDKCGLTSELCFTATAGSQYTLQVGNFPGSSGTSGTFTVTSSAGGGTNDDCATPTVISGLGPHNFDTTVATTGCQGQDNTVCTFFGASSVETDVWFTWTAPASGLFQVSLCGTAGGFDSKVAVYAGAGCPASNSAIACDDDGCGTIAGESKACFNATAGATYTIEVGAFPGAGGTTGTFSFSAVAAPTGCQYDNGTSENSVGLTAGGAMMWMHHFGSVGGTSTVNSVKSAFGTPLFPGGTPPVGTPVVATVYNDPTNDNDPTDAVLLQQAPGVVGNIDNDVFDTFTLTPQATSGIYFVGVSISHASGQFPAPLDQDNCPAGSAGRAWVVGDTTGVINLTTLSANNVPPLEMDSIGLPGVWLLRADCTGSVGTAGCFGDGTGTACPCGNNSTVAGTGCQHSFSASLYGGSGAKLAGTGGASLSADTVQLQATTLPPSTTCLFFQGTTPTSVAFGDGLRCAGGSVTRLGQRPVSGGARNFGEGVAGDPEIHTVGLVVAPGTREYQNWFRNTASFCTPAGFNLTNRLSITWAP